jgi:type II secretory pathway component PulJ
MNSVRTKQSPVRCRAQRFTLVELLAAMAVLVVMMFLLFRFIAGAQQAWSVATSSQEVYEKARIALDLITRDLQCAVARANDVPGQHIRFQQVSADQIRFVSNGAIGAAGSDSAPSASLLAEVGYQFDTYAFDRALENSAGAATGWNIYQDRSGVNPSCVNQQGGFYDVIDGVLGLQFLCYNDSLVPVLPWIGTGIETGLPYAVDVRLRVMDSKSFLRWKLLNTADRSRLESEVALSFSKMIFLGGRQ